MLQDSWGHDVSTTSPEALAACDAAVIDLLENRLTMGDNIKAAIEADPQCIMGLVMRGYMFLQFSSQVVAGKIAETIEALDGLDREGTAREQLHVKALRTWGSGHVHEARRCWHEIVDANPRDLLALRLHHFLSFWQGDRNALRALPQEAHSKVDATMPGYGFVLSMVAFGNEENGDYKTAEDFGRRAVDLNGNDLWGLHAVAHVMEMQGRAKDGLDWLNQPLDCWADRNPFQGHVWWHTALFALEVGDFDRVLEIYDAKVAADERGFYLDMQNSASLLMRLQLLGIDVGARWQALGAIAAGRIGDHVMPFTDAHFMLSLIGAGEFETAGRYLASQQAFAAAGGSDAAEVTRDVGLALGEALIAYGEGRFGGVVERLQPKRAALSALGGSHAQRDIFQQILIDAAIKAGRVETARALLAERAQLMAGSAWGKQQQALVA